MARFLVLFLAPARVMEDWAKTDPAQRKPAEDKMRQAWGEWMGAHATAVADMQAAGKTKRAGQDGVTAVRNDIMLYCTVTADSHEDAARMFENHPHLGIPEAWIEIMESRPMSGA